MKVVAKETNWGNGIVKGKFYECVKEDTQYYYIADDNGDIGGVFKHRFYKLDNEGIEFIFKETDF
jgi:hypothetical protein